ncbi:leucyl/phenylalanyl-tRNA--protein transferase [Thermochromatium tepidum]|uniref:Leucyl/phenylalanyl-tRNA--protein transferase n=1 Tax=Thermochromatium tepidum ATCC 43061 TaxID=316276 RepID=A0A6I6E8F8_THETI|nr:leucyl/phenylalanyl-tRNA--protein transferase [Thermochromatium tepidum]QGU31606.1 leucyl/phenylalanyl-tRNA--protein transferase [Thermochromatium tepidum ATCC 43061]
MIALLDPCDRTTFPDPGQALREPNGLLAVGGDLSPERLIEAYRGGIFPWFGAGDPILWWSPDPRAILFPEHFHASRSLRKRLRRGDLVTTLDRDFAGVIQGCSEPRDAEAGTWLIPEMMAAYRRLHDLGLAHSVEVWRAGSLVGGLYGVAIGRVFFGESMFSRVSDASKVALARLCEQLRAWGFGLIDCQMTTKHLLRLGACEVSRAEFLTLLDHYGARPGYNKSWDDGTERPACAIQVAPPSSGDDSNS